MPVNSRSLLELKYSAEPSGAKPTEWFMAGASAGVRSVSRSCPAGTVRSTSATCSELAVTGEETVTASHRPSAERTASAKL
jgi:hypothetical protein